MNRVRYERGEADGGWRVKVNADLTVEFLDYADGAYPAGSQLVELPLVELAHPTTAAEMLGDPDMKPWEL